MVVDWWSESCKSPENLLADFLELKTRIFLQIKIQGLGKAKVQNIFNCQTIYEANHCNEIKWAQKVTFVDHSLVQHLGSLD